MPNTRKLQLSFGGGEIDPEMYSRIDSDQNQSGLAKVQNWLVDPKGPLKKRPGFQRVSSSFDSSRKSRLIPFTYSVDQSLVIELSHEKIRFISDGKLVTWADTLTFLASGVSNASNTITFSSDHKLTTNDEIVFHEGLSASLPTGLDEGETYLAIVTGSDTIQVKPDIGGSAISFSGTTLDGSGGLRLYRKSSLPRNFKVADEAANIFITGGNGSVLNFGNPSGFYHGQKVQIQQDINSETNQNLRLPESFKVPLYVDFGTSASIGDTSGQFGSHTFALRYSLEQVGTQATVPTSVINSSLNSRHSPNGTGTSYAKLFLTAYYEIGDTAFIPRDISMVSSPSFYSRGIVAVRDNAAPKITTLTANTAATDFLALNQEGFLENDSPYSEDELFEIEYEQTGDIITLTHPNHTPREIRRYSNTDWRLIEVDLTPTILPPFQSTFPVEPIVTSTRGVAYEIVAYVEETGSANNSGVQIEGTLPVSGGDTVYIDFITAQGNGIVPIDGYYNVINIVPSGNNTNVFLREIASGTPVDIQATTTGDNAGRLYISSSSGEETEKYKITSVDVNLQESLPTEEIVATNILAVPGATNTIQFKNAVNAVSYKIYKELNGIYGFIGAVDATPGNVSAFTDDYIGPDMSDTLPLQDEQVASGYRPRAVASFEQRRCFAGSNNLPRTLFMSRSGTQSSFTYQMPIQASDRVSVQIASREAHTIRHMVGLQDLIILTQQGEWMVTAINSDAIGPETIAIRPQSYIGSNKVRPAVVNNKIVFCANRGGHVRELGFQTQNQGYLTGDLSLRATHLFNGQELTDLAYSKAPTPRLWFVSTSGKLLCLTYVPEEKVLAWQQIVTDGTFESVCAIPEGNFDNVYVVVNRTDSTGATVRSIERMVAVDTEDRSDAVYFDASVSVNGTNTGLRTLEVTSSGLYKSGDVVSVICNEAGVFAESNVGEEIEFTSGTNAYRMRVTVYTSTTQVEAVLLADLPSTLHSTPTTVWAIASKTITGYAHLANQTVSVLADGEMHKDVVVSSLGVLILDKAAVKVCAGLKYTTEAQTLPVSLQMEAGGQGRTKIINKVYLRVKDSSNLSVGSEASDMIDVGDLSSTKLSSGEFETKIPDSWDQEGQIVIQSTDGLPSTVLGLTAQISIGD